MYWVKYEKKFNVCYTTMYEDFVAQSQLIYFSKAEMWLILVTDKINSL
jgi:hypothetical protein